MPYGCLLIPPHRSYTNNLSTPSQTETSKTRHVCGLDVWLRAHGALRHVFWGRGSFELDRGQACVYYVIAVHFNKQASTLGTASTLATRALSHCPHTGGHTPTPADILPENAAGLGAGFRRRGRISTSPGPASPVQAACGQRSSPLSPSAVARRSSNLRALAFIALSFLSKSSFLDI